MEERKRVKKKGRSRKAACQGPGVKAWRWGRAAGGCSKRLHLNSQRRQSKALGWRFISRLVLRSNLALDDSERLGSCGGCSLLFANRASWLSKGGLFELGYSGGPLLTTDAPACWGAHNRAPLNHLPHSRALPLCWWRAVLGASLYVKLAPVASLQREGLCLPGGIRQKEGWGTARPRPRVSLLQPLEAGCDTRFQHTRLSYGVFWLGRERTQVSFSGEAAETTWPKAPSEVPSPPLGRTGKVCPFTRSSSQGHQGEPGTRGLASGVSNRLLGGGNPGTSQPNLCHSPWASSDPSLLLMGTGS